MTDEMGKMENYEAYWKLVNAIDELCGKAIGEDALYSEDIVSALDRVKMHFFEEYLEARFGLKVKGGEK